MSLDICLYYIRIYSEFLMGITKKWSLMSADMNLASLFASEMVLFSSSLVSNRFTTDAPVLSL